MPARRRTTAPWPYFTAPPVLCAAHLWSIGVEEQFYLVWPWLMRLAGRRPLAMFTLVVLAGFALNDSYSYGARR